MNREEKQWEQILEQILSRLNDLKLSIISMIQVLETQYETINWPTFLDNFALISSHVSKSSFQASQPFKRVFAAHRNLENLEPARWWWLFT